VLFIWGSIWLRRGACVDGVIVRHHLMMCQGIA
jgi:hypothetical protein